ncbi:mitofilin family membrane protein [Thalassospira marina]|uniref:Uroporphyrinogen III synthase n=1 Tax=Thalassospira marina TaxID=2048283 RepID=A0A2N3KNA0_9PROT|nr:mitofilin family membrane protein [Thalassospira marina]PKR52041.1 uroporphyrinogen III synthase [Thalassospira marina]
MKKPETPKTDTSATPAKGQDTISIDSKGNASAAKPATPSGDASAKPASGTNTSAPTGSTSTSSAKPAGGATASTSSASGSNSASTKPGTSTTSSATSGTAKPGDKNAAAGKATPQGKKANKPAIMVVIWAVIIVGIVLALGWASRAMWWKQAEPTLANMLPQSTVDALAPEEAQNTADMQQPANGTASGNGNMAANSPADQPAESTSPDSSANTSENGSADVMATDNASKGDGVGNMGMDTQQAAPNADAPNNTGDEPATASGAISGSDSTEATDPADTAEAQAKNVVVATDLTSRLSHLEGTINALRERLDSERGGEINDSVARRLGELETRTAPIDEVARVQSELSGVAKEMRDLTARMATVEDELKATEGLRIAGRGQAIGIGIAILRDAAQRGGPFEVALNQLNRSGSDDTIVQKQIEALKPLAANGAPRIEQLRQSFPLAADEAIKAASDDHSGGVWDSTVANLKKLFPIRRVDAVGQETLDGRLVSAEQALAQDNLADAISALEGVEGESAKAALEPWLAKARARQTINVAIETLSSHAIGLLTGQEDKTGNTPINNSAGSEAAQ